MSNKLDIIIPCYNAHDTIDISIGSILAQKTDVETAITLVNDDGNSYNNVIKRYTDVIPIQEISYEDNKGPGYARNFGLEHTNNPYVMFMDADDVLVNPFAIRTFLSNFDDKTCMIISNIVAEDKLGHFRRIKKNKNYLHGKMYKRSFLDKYKIRFNNSRCCEDASFNLICQCILDDESECWKILDFDSYGWLFNKNSLGRKNVVEWEYNTVPKSVIDNFIYAFDFLSKVKSQKEKIYGQKIYAMVYCLITWEIVTKHYPQYKETVDNVIKTCYDKIYKDIEKQVTDEQFEAVFNGFLHKSSIEYTKGILDNLRRGEI